jgi:hypothetical protein
METQKEDTFWKWVNEKFHIFMEELKKDSVATNPRKPVDCCNPPTPPRLKQPLKKSDD